MMSAPLQPKTIRVNDVELAYVEQGAGEPVVFVHGGLNDYRAWGAQLDPFGERYRAVAYSRRHHWPNAGAETAAAYALSGGPDPTPRGTTPSVVQGGTAPRGQSCRSRRTPWRARRTRRWCAGSWAAR